jgi:release factor glutamine methyltransferase
MRTALEPRRPSTFVVQGREWDLLPDVGTPHHLPLTAIGLELLDLSSEIQPGVIPLGATLLELGSGTGVISVMAALNGSARVIATDTNPAAVRNTKLNAARHGVDDRVSVVRGDLFDGLATDERFDVIFWSAPYRLPPVAFLAEAPRRLTPDGSALVHFTTRGNLVALLRAADAHGRGLHILRSLDRATDGHDVNHMLIKITTPSTG